MAGSIYVDPLIAQLAKNASAKCGLDPDVILAQWDCEQGVGSTSTWYYNDPAGMTAGIPQADALSNGTGPAGFLTFPTPAAGAEAYADFYLYGSAYANVREAIQSGNAMQEIAAIAASPWDSGHYGGQGQKLYAAYAGITGTSIPAQADLTAGATPSGSTESAPTSPSATNTASTAIQFPPSNYSVVANSQRTGNVLYNRRYRVVVQTSQGLTLDVSDLRCSFDIQYVLNQQPPFCTIVIYNLNPATEDLLLNYGDQVTLEAGYWGNQYGVIFSGTIVEPIRSQADNVTYLLTLNCLQADRAANQAFAAFSVNKGQNARSMITALATKATVPTPVGDISASLSSVKLPRGKTVFGLTRDYLRQIAQGSGLGFHLTNGTINMLGSADAPKGTIVDLSPSSGLIAIPSQDGLGVDFSCLLNPGLVIGALVHIDNALITPETFPIGTVPRALDTAGIYRIMSVEHAGDTRDTQWQTNCSTVSQAGGIPGMVSATTDQPYN